jgi:hypothetical protein
MNTNKLLRFASIFYSLAAGEELPADSDDLKTVLSNIEGLETYGARKKYAEANLGHLSSGSSRITYLTKDKNVIKLAKADKGIAQNSAEVEAGSKCESKYINKTLDNAKDFSWIKVPFCNKITEKDFKGMTKIDFNDFGEAIRYALKEISGNSDKKKPKKYDETAKSEIFKDITSCGKACDLMPGDIARISSFGEKDNHPILLDLGLSKKVFSDHYEDSESSYDDTSST